MTHRRRCAPRPRARPTLAARSPASRPFAEARKAACGLVVVVGGMSAFPALAEDEPAPAATAAPEGYIVERIVAVVDRSVVMQSELEQALDEMMRLMPPSAGTDLLAVRESRRAQVLDQLIADKLLDAEIRKLNIDVTDAEVDRVVQGTIAQRGLSMAQLEQALAAQGMTVADYREGLKDQLLKAKLIQLKVKNRVRVSDQDVKSTYAREKTMAARAYKVRARHILFLAPEGEPDGEARRKAEDALRRARAGEDFAALATALSEGPSAKSGGALGTFGRGEMVPAFEEAAFAAKPGQIIGPVRTSFGWHVILVEERVVDGKAPLDDVQDQLRQQLYEQEVEAAFGRYVDELRQAAYVEVRLEVPSR